MVLICKSLYANVLNYSSALHDVDHDSILLQIKVRCADPVPAVSKAAKIAVKVITWKP